ncbi:MAG: metal ABC transporter permease [Candidatus Kerfeldbacteria bacterium CG15_BIG_FIL_POST_REV_8_21_14_020_45_12]|uniref:Metal ABC transporter permease n=1 Tax=Candidatus Kerfeldbacteria bacterium CG15_BIG_FIL_POST_REV_8_21_14_020_45_12 TaxID=2014247 RepID=A0A2M7H2U3_9BACT|nr:MAG: metal ABC transporter permease [Candidatus Kerfeldbacteria bacterium CG15_BIG_FIL_POST_REV_8_21_14_020_45_12]PJA93216.1 MAG: metal ABC transporter permease [Candidatus Kerfeldbacteria bacterium CG_4_9_14_3_um_filter_45_8]
MFLEIFQFEFMQRAFLAGAVIAVIAPLIGNYLVVRRYSLMFDTLAHVGLTGVAIGVLLHTQPVVTAIVVTVLAALGIEYLRERREILGESVLAIFLSGSLALAVVLMSIAGGLNVDLLSFLFGSITTVTSTDLYFILILGAVTILTIVLLYKELFLISFDQELARANGLPVRLLNNLIVVLAAITVALSMRIVGALLIGALMVIPVVAAVQARRSFVQTILISIVIAALSVFFGLIFSYYFDLASGGTIVLHTLAFFALSLLFTRKT